MINLQTKDSDDCYTLFKTDYAGKERITIWIKNSVLENSMIDDGMTPFRAFNHSTGEGRPLAEDEYKILWEEAEQLPDPGYDDPMTTTAGHTYQITPERCAQFNLKTGKKMADIFWGEDAGGPFYLYSMGKYLTLPRWYHYCFAETLTGDWARAEDAANDIKPVPPNTLDTPIKVYLHPDTYTLVAGE